MKNLFNCRNYLPNYKSSLSNGSSNIFNYVKNLINYIRNLSNCIKNLINNYIRHSINRNIMRNFNCMRFSYMRYMKDLFKKKLSRCVKNLLNIKLCNCSINSIKYNRNLFDYKTKNLKNSHWLIITLFNYNMILFNYMINHLNFRMDQLFKLWMDQF